MERMLSPCRSCGKNSVCGSPSMSLKSIEGTPSEQLRGDISHACSLEASVLEGVMGAVMKFVGGGQDTERLLASLSALSSEHGLSPALLKFSARGLVHISSVENGTPRAVQLELFRKILSLTFCLLPQIDAPSTLFYTPRIHVTCMSAVFALTKRRLCPVRPILVFVCSNTSCKEV